MCLWSRIRKKIKKIKRKYAGYFFFLISFGFFLVLIFVLFHYLSTVGVFVVQKIPKLIYSTESTADSVFCYGGFLGNFDWTISSAWAIPFSEREQHTPPKTKQGKKKGVASPSCLVLLSLFFPFSLFFLAIHSRSHLFSFSFSTRF